MNIYCVFDQSGQRLYEVWVKESQHTESYAVNAAEERASSSNETVGLYEARTTNSCTGQLFAYIRDKKYREAASLLRSGSMSIQHIRDFK